MRLIKRKTLKSTRIFSVEEFILDKDGRRLKEYGVFLSETVSILAFLDSNHILLERQYRAPIDKYLYEIPAGHVDKGESPLNAAKRELKEETGYSAASTVKVVKFYPSPGLMNELQHLYIARKLKKGKTALEKNEEISVESMSIHQALRMVRSGKITDAKTIISLLYYKLFMSK